MTARSDPRRDSFVRHPHTTFDFVLAAGVALVLGGIAVGLGNMDAALVTMGLSVALMLRRVLPVVSLLIALGSACYALLVSAQPSIAVVIVPMLIFSYARWAPRRVGQASLVAGLAGALLGPLRWTVLAGAVNFAALGVLVLACAAIVIGAFLFGRRVRETNENLAERAQAQSEREQLAGAALLQRERVAAMDERARIARELHDIVAHSLSVIVVQAEGGRALSLKRPERGSEILGTIAETGREALEEMRRMVGLLRGGDADGVEFAPMPGLEDIADLVRKTSESFEYDVSGTIPAVSPALGLTGYRLVQESLTNVLKHAGPAARARVTLACTATAIEIDVADDGRGAEAETSASGPGQPERSAGHGIQGMRERVALHDGRLTAAPRSGGGFVVRAWLPVAGEAPAPSPTQPIRLVS
jgi:signal transduction histidine kinase